MILRRRRKSRAASSWDGLKFAKPTRPSDSAERKERAAWISEIRRLVFGRDRVCRACRKPPDHMHEIRTRAQLRGRSFREIFTLSNCIALCEECHRRVHRQRVRGYWLRIIGLDANVPGGLEFERVTTT